MVDLQEEGSETGKTGNAREASDLSGTGGGNGRRGLGGLLTRGRNGATSGLGNTRDGAVGVGRRRRDGSGLRAVVADDSGGGDDGLGDGARAVGDGQSGGLSDGVGLGAVSDLGGLRAVGHVGLDDLSDNGDVAGVASHGTGGGSKSDSESVLHLDGIKVFSRKTGIRYERWWLTKVLD